MLEKESGAWETIDDPVLMIALTEKGVVYVEGNLPSPAVVRFLDHLTTGFKSGQYNLHQGCGHDHEAPQTQRESTEQPDRSAPSPYL